MLIPLVKTSLYPAKEYNPRTTPNRSLNEPQMKVFLNILSNLLTPLFYVLFPRGKISNLTA